MKNVLRVIAGLVGILFFLNGLQWIISPANVANVLAQLELGTNLCLAAECDALVTAPVNKASIIESGTPFTGQTEFLANLTGVQHPLMLLHADSFNVALLTTHIPLAAVPGAITGSSLEAALRLLDAELKARFGLTCQESPYWG